MPLLISLWTWAILISFCISSVVGNFGDGPLYAVIAIAISVAITLPICHIGNRAKLSDNLCNKSQGPTEPGRFGPASASVPANRKPSGSPTDPAPCQPESDERKKKEQHFEI